MPVVLLPESFRGRLLLRRGFQLLIERPVSPAREFGTSQMIEWQRMPSTARLFRMYLTAIRTVLAALNLVKLFLIELKTNYGFVVASFVYIMNLYT